MLFAGHLRRSESCALIIVLHLKPYPQIEQILQQQNQIIAAALA